MLQTPQPHHASSPSARAGLIGRFFAPAESAPQIAGNDQEIKAQFKYWQKRVVISSLIGYAIFYIVRKNLSIAMPLMEKDLGITKTQLGIFLTLHGLIYGVSKFANGYLGDRSNARSFMVCGLILSALCNIAFGFSSAVFALGIFWMANGWFQGMGFPPCARLMTHWIPPRELATKMSVWNTSHSIGAGLVVVLCGYLVVFGWRWALFGPAIIALLGSVFIWMTLPDTPRSVGLPELTETELGKSNNTGSPAEFKAFVRKHVFGNPYIWIFAFANFFVYAMRYAILDWGPTVLHQFKGFDLKKAALMTGAFELSGIAGMLLMGWLTDKVFKSRGARTCFFCMGMAALSVLAFWKLPELVKMLTAAGIPNLKADSLVLNTITFCCAGFFIYGPQALVGIAVANLATKKAAGTAIGFTGLFGYASTILSGWGLGSLVDKHGWDAAFLGIMTAGLIGTILFACAWPAKAHGYNVEPDRKPVT